MIVINPAAGKASYEKRLRYLQAKLNEHSMDFECFFTKKEPSVSLNNMLQQSEKPFSDIVVMGGDGTLNRVVNEMRNHPLPVSIVSNGTGNDSVKSLHGVMDFKQQVDIALHGKTKLFDLGICNERLFVNGVGIGFDGEVVRHMHERGDKRGRHIDYLLTVLRIVAGFKEKKLCFSMDGQRFSKKIFLMTISNGSTFGGGFVINPFAVADDGKLDVCLINEIKPWLRFIHLPKLKTGTHYKIKAAEFHVARQLEIDKADNLVAHLDGEYLGHPPFTISIAPKALAVNVPGEL